MHRIARAGWFVVATLSMGSVAHVAGAQTAAPASSGAPATVNGPARAAGQGVAVVAIGSNAHEQAFALARAVYGSRLRPVTLDEVRARVLAGGTPPPNASRELRDLAELRAAIGNEDAAGRRLLSGIAQQVGVEALLVVRVEAPTAAPAPAAPAPTTTTPTTTAPAAAGAAQPASDAGAASQGRASGPETPATPNAAGNAALSSTVVARLFLADAGDFDAARYSPESPESPEKPGTPGPVAWKSTVTSLEGRFPVASRAAGPTAATRPAPAVRPEEQKSSPFYTSAWFWGALGGAALLGGAFYLVSQDTGSEPIHLQMRLPK